MGTLVFGLTRTTSSAEAHGEALVFIRTPCPQRNRPRWCLLLHGGVGPGHHVSLDSPLVFMSCVGAPSWLSTWASAIEHVINVQDIIRKRWAGRDSWP